MFKEVPRLQLPNYNCTLVEEQYNYMLFATSENAFFIQWHGTFTSHVGHLLENGNNNKLYWIQIITQTEDRVLEYPETNLKRRFY